VEAVKRLVKIVNLIAKDSESGEVLQLRAAVTGDATYVVNTDTYTGHSFDVETYYASTSETGGSTAALSVHTSVDGGDQFGVEGLCCDSLVGDNVYDDIAPLGGIAEENTQRSGPSQASKRDARVSHEGSMSHRRLVEHVLALALMDTLHKACLVPANECRGQVDAMAFVEVLRDLVRYKSPRAAHVTALVVSAFEATLAHSSRGRPFHMLPDEGHSDKRRKDALGRALSIVCGQPDDFSFTIHALKAAGKTAQAQQIERVRDRLQPLARNFEVYSEQVISLVHDNNNRLWLACS
jgi:hypothetical protein